MGLGEEFGLYHHGIAVGIGEFFLHVPFNIEILAGKGFFEVLVESVRQLAVNDNF